MSGPMLLATPHFLRDHRAAGVGLQRLAERKIQDLVRRAESDPTGWRRQYDRVASLRDKASVLEIDLAGGPRLLAVDHGDVLTLWRMGDHDITERARSTRLPTR